jgi:hypothetical protein
VNKLPAPVPAIRATGTIRDTATPDTPTRAGKYRRPATLAPRYCYQRVRVGLGNLPWYANRRQWQRRLVVTPTDPQTPAQLLVRETLYAAKVAWDLWAQADRDLWTAAAAGRPLSGYNLWLSAVLTPP